MGVTCTGADRTVCISLTGEVDHHRAREIMNRIDLEVDRQLPRRVTLDLEGVTFMDSSGIAVLLRCYKRVGQLSGSMTVRNVPDQAAKVLRAAGIDRIIKFEE